MVGSAAGLLSPRRLVGWYLILVFVGVALMLTAGPPDSFEPNPVLEPAPALIGEGTDN